MDDDEPTKKPAHLTKPDFESFSIAALNDYIGELEAEIARAREAISKKDGARNLADSFFRNPG